MERTWHYAGKGLPAILNINQHLTLPHPEPRLGALRGSRAGTAYPAVQVSAALASDNMLQAYIKADDLSIFNHQCPNTDNLLNIPTQF